MAARRQITMDAFLGANLKSRRSVTMPAAPRSASEASTLSCITLHNDAPLPSSTPPTSIDCGSSSISLSMDAKAEPIVATTTTTSTTEEQGAIVVTTTTTEETETEASTTTTGRSRRARTSVASYNENTLVRNNTTRRPQPSSTSGVRRRDLSGRTLVADGGDGPSSASPGKEARDSFVQESIQVLDLDWTVDALPGEKLDLASQAGIAGDGTKTTGGRSKALLHKASIAMDKTKSVLGKRTREIIGASKSGAKDLGRRASLRARDVLQQAKEANKAASASEEPDAKRRKTDAKKSAEPESTKAAAAASADGKRKPARVNAAKDKRWLRQGLYVGQEDGFDPRLKPGDVSKRAQKAREKLQKQGKDSAADDGAPSGKGSSGKKTKRTMLPLPMFAGKRLLEGPGPARDYKLPFDVFHPLPPGQAKPDEWRRTGKNHFVGDSAEYWRKGKKMEFSTCQCTWPAGCDDDCFNRCMFYECDASNCALGDERCGNRAFMDLKDRVRHGGKYNVGVEVLKTEHKGYGVRSPRTFQPGQIIVEYTGEIITQDECDQRMRTTYKDNECFYLMMFDQNMIIDATRGSIARFVNHSCEPNCKMVKWTVDGKPRMALFAGDAGIMTGEELTYDYNFDPFSAKNIQECHCGSASCRGFLGPRPTNPREPSSTAAAGGNSGSNSSSSKRAPASASSSAATAAASAATGAKRKLKDAVEEVRSKKRRLSADMGALLRLQQKAKEANEKEDRAARAKLRADIKGARSKRVVAAKLTKRTRDGRKVTVVKVGASPVKGASPAKVAAAGGGGGAILSPSKKHTATVGRAVRSSVDTVRSNVVRTIKGARAGNAAAAARSKGKTIKVVRPADVDVDGVPDVPA